MSRIPIQEILNSREFKTGKLKAIVKVLVDGRRALVGFERKKSSRKHHEKILTGIPIILDELQNRSQKRNVGESDINDSPAGSAGSREEGDRETPLAPGGAGGGGR